MAQILLVLLKAERVMQGHVAEVVALSLTENFAENSTAWKTVMSMHPMTREIQRRQMTIAKTEGNTNAAAKVWGWDTVMAEEVAERRQSYW